VQKTLKAEMRTIVFVDAVNFTSELKTHGKPIISPKINRLQEFVEFFFVYKLKGEFIGKMGDGFLVLCPPTPPEVIASALSCQEFVRAYNVGKDGPGLLNARIAIHYGLISPPQGGNYIDTNLNITARLEGATPANCTCISSTLHDIVVDTLRELTFEKMASEFKGLGENKYYLVTDRAGGTSEPTRQEARLSFYISTLSALHDAESWEAAKTTCEQALLDFPSNPEFISQLAFSLYRLEDYPGSIRYYEQCVTKGYESGRALLYIGRAYDAMGNSTHALDVFLQAVANDEVAFHALCDIADIHFMRRDLANAKEWAEKSLKANSYFISPMALLVAIGIINDDNHAAAEVLKRVDAGRRGMLRRFAEQNLQRFRQKGFKRKLDELFENG
jgi:class 3 adenylate cyclase